jgi:hypothetical protein
LEETHGKDRRAIFASFDRKRIYFQKHLELDETLGRTRTHHWAHEK